MDILSWTLKQVFNDGSIDIVEGFPSVQSAENYIVKRNRVVVSSEIIPDYWEPVFRNNLGELDLNVGI